MSQPVIKVEGLGKRYIIGHQKEEKYTALRDVISNTVKSILTPNNSERENREEFWALKDLNFEINQGDRVGIIGRNGAGKSTLLKVLSRITEPTTGSIKIRGRVASLLEVGTGFHPELTGRENIFLNGAILGMGRQEIKKKFDEIVDFAEVEKFLDTPVKRYSSGMYVRLAFAVAAHLEPEILIVDEVLAVGDVQFQKKCLGKMKDVGKEGRTVLFVSHNMSAITQLCDQGIYLDSGEIGHSGNINSVMKHYITQGANKSSRVKLINNNSKANLDKKFFFREVAIIGKDRVESPEIDIRCPFYIDLEYEVIKELTNVELSIRIYTSEGIPVLTSCQSDCSPQSTSIRKPGVYQTLIKIPEMFLMPGSYMLSIAAHEPMVEMFDAHEHIILFNIADTGTKYAKYNQAKELGVVIVDLFWQEKQTAAV